MPRTDDSDDDFEGGWDDEGDDLPDDSAAATITCPYCGEDIYEDAQRCPHCDQYISAETSGASPKPWWVIAGVVVLLYVLIRSLVP
jgi:hypothetical protein